MPPQLIHMRNLDEKQAKKLVEELERIQAEDPNPADRVIFCRPPETLPPAYLSGREARRKRRALERKTKRGKKLF